MSGIRDGIKRNLSSSSEITKVNEGLADDEFISINNRISDGLNYQDVQAESFYPTPVWRFNISESDMGEIENLVLAVYEIKKQEPEGNVRSNFNSWQSPDDLHERPEFEKFTKMILNIAEVQIHNYPWQCIGMWAGINPKGGGNHVHAHEGVLSGTIWLAAETESSGGLAFIDPRIRSKMSGARGNFLFSTSNKGYHPVPGAGVIFPAWLEHFVFENKSEEERISISFNLM